MDNVAMPVTAVFYEPASEQVQSWHYHARLGEDVAHQVVTVDSMVKDLDVEAMGKAIEAMIRRHESLRTYFEVVDNEIRQGIIPYHKELFTPVYYDMSAARDKDSMIGEMKNIIDAGKHSLRKLNRPPLLRAYLFKMSENEYYLCLLIHHIIADEWSASLIYKELAASYLLLKSGQEINSSPLRLQLRDYASWQKKWLKENAEAIHRYWTEKIRTFDQEWQQGTMAREQRLGILNEGRAAAYNCVVNGAQYSQLIQLSKKCGSTIWSVIITSLQLLFYRIAGKERILIAMPMTSRFLPGSESLIGYLGGGIYLYRPVKQEMLVRDFIKEGYFDFLEAATNIIYDHDEMNLDGQGMRCKCDIFINFLSKEMAGNKKPYGENNKHRPLEGPEYYSLSYNVFEYQDGLSFCWKYNLDLYDAEKVGTIVKNHEVILQAICQTPEGTIRELMDNCK
jgi:surfactin family lipopeptide synthetase A